MHIDLNLVNHINIPTIYSNLLLKLNPQIYNWQFMIQYLNNHTSFKIRIRFQIQQIPNKTTDTGYFQLFNIIFHNKYIHSHIVTKYIDNLSKTYYNTKRQYKMNE